MGNETEHVVACGAHVFGSEVGKRLVFGTHITSPDARKAHALCLTNPVCSPFEHSGERTHSRVFTEDLHHRVPLVADFARLTSPATLHIAAKKRSPLRPATADNRRTLALRAPLSTAERIEGTCQSPLRATVVTIVTISIPSTPTSQ